MVLNLSEMIPLHCLLIRLGVCRDSLFRKGGACGSVGTADATRIAAGQVHTGAAEVGFATGQVQLGLLRDWHGRWVCRAGTSISGAASYW